jgi:uncharacterized membrane protein SirB2
MKWLVLLHVLSAIIGVGPTFFSHVLLRKNQNVSELRQSMKLVKRLEIFPKVGGSIAVLSGLALILLNDYGTFLQTWLIGSLILYILIQIVAAGIIPRKSKRLAELVESHATAKDPTDEKEIHAHLHFVSKWMYVATTLGTLLFIFMIMKPH